MVWPTSADADHDPVTGVERETLEFVGKKSVNVPYDFVSIPFSFSPFSLLHLNGVHEP